MSVHHPILHLKKSLKNTRVAKVYHGFHLFTVKCFILFQIQSFYFSFYVAPRKASYISQRAVCNTIVVYGTQLHWQSLYQP